MDAKKIEKVVKPRYLKDTKAARNSTIIAAGGVLFSIACGFLYHFYVIKARPRRLYTDNPIHTYTQSEEYKIRTGMLLNLLPPPRALVQQYSAACQCNYSRGRVKYINKKINMLDEDLDDSALFCKTLIQKRKALGNGNPKNSKQLKLQFSQFSSETNEQDKDKQLEPASNKNYVGEKIRESKTQDWNSKCNESRSSYFNDEKSSNTCPLCLKSFKSDSAYSAHMKQCAKIHKMTTKQLLGALELQKKHLQERKDFGLCSQKSSLPIKTAASKKKIEKDLESYDLALGLALSKSLSTIKPKSVTMPEAQKPHSSQTLEEFGFISRNAFSGPCTKRKEINKKSILKERTGEERQRIIIEKVAVILLDKNEGKESENKVNPNVQVPELWSMGENSEKRRWYVDEIKRLVFPEEEISEKKEKSTDSDNMDQEISKLNLPQYEIFKDWNKMVNNSKFSDFTGKTKDCRDVYLHSVVLFVRCPELLEKDCQSILQKFDLSTVVILLEYIYCGTLNGLIRTEMDNLFKLATEFDYDELINVLNCLKNNLSLEDDHRGSNSPPEISENEVKQQETVPIESKKPDILEDRDLFTEVDVIDLTQDIDESAHEKIRESLSENETNSEKSFWSFVQHEKNRQGIEKEKAISTEVNIQHMNESDEDDVNLENKRSSDNTYGLQRKISSDSATRDSDYELKKTDTKISSDCVILSSGSDSRTQDNLIKPRSSRTPSPPINVDYEVPHFDPYDNFHCFTEEPFSPVAVPSQSLITGDVSMESLKSSDQDNPHPVDGSQTEEAKKTVAYCSTPVTIRRSSKIKSSRKNSLETSRKKKRCDLTSNRIIRKSLGLQRKGKISNSSKKVNAKKKEIHPERDLAEVLANSILHELSKSSVFQSPPSSRRKFVEMTPVSNREEFEDDVTPSPNYSNMGETLLKEQLTKYGLKRNLAKSKAKKILRHIYEELHPLYNTETGKIVKMLPSNTPIAGKKSKPKEDSLKNVKSKRSKNVVTEKSKPEKRQKNHFNSSKESEALSDRSTLSIDRLTEYDSDESEFENISDTLTQSVPSNPIDLPSAFSDFLQNNSEFHEKILLYEPIWLEELQKKLKETFKKHYKISDLMDFLDKKCITFRSEAQAKNLQKRYEKKKGNLKKKKSHSS